MAARDCQDRVPELFAAFMTTADAAVDGREALTTAPSLPLAGGAEPEHAWWRRAPMRVRPPMPWPRSRPCSAIVSPMPPPWLTRQAIGPPARRPRQRPGGSAS